MLKKFISGLLCFALTFSAASAGVFASAKIELPVQKSDDFVEVVDFIADYKYPPNEYLSVYDISTATVLYDGFSEEQKALVRDRDKLTEICKAALANDKIYEVTVEMTVDEIDKLDVGRGLDAAYASVYYYLLSDEQKAQVGNAQKLLDVCASLRDDGLFVPGDFDFDGVPTVNDALRILQSTVGKINIINIQKKYCDVNGDGRVTVTDALIVLDPRMPDFPRH